MKEEPVEQNMEAQENHTPANNHLGDTEPAFSDDEEDQSTPTISRNAEDEDDDDDIPLGDARSQSLHVMTLWLI